MILGILVFLGLFNVQKIDVQSKLVQIFQDDDVDLKDLDVDQNKALKNIETDAQFGKIYRITKLNKEEIYTTLKNDSNATYQLSLDKKLFVRFKANKIKDAIYMQSRGKNSSFLTIRNDVMTGFFIINKYVYSVELLGKDVYVLVEMNK